MPDSRVSRGDGQPPHVGGGTTVQRLGSDDPLASPNTISESGKTRQTLVAPG